MTTDTNIYWGTFRFHDWRLYLAATEAGLCYIGSPNAPFSELESWVSKKIKHPVLQENDEKVVAAKHALQDYLHGETNEFQMPVDAIGTTFQKAVWQASTQIPYGETRTYQEIATTIDKPNAVRAVGTAIGANPLLMIIPCHRIVAKNGSLSGFRAGLDMKKFLLELEQQHAR